MQNNTRVGTVGLLLLIGTLLVGCQGRTTSDKDLVLIEFDRVRELQTAAAANGSGTRLVIIDTRQPSQFARGHIPGAVNIPLADLAGLPDNDPRLRGANYIVVYGHDWADARGPAGAKKLIQEGYDNVYDFRGGLELWVARGGPVVQGTR